MKNKGKMNDITIRTTFATMLTINSIVKMSDSMYPHLFKAFSPSFFLAMIARMRPTGAKIKAKTKERIDMMFSDDEDCGGGPCE